MKFVLLFSFYVLFSFNCSSQIKTTETENISTFIKVWGFLKYFHPNVAKGEFDWDKEYILRVKEVSTIHSRAELSSYYSNWIDSLGSIKGCKKCVADFPDSLKIYLDIDWIKDFSLFSDSLILRLNNILINRHQGKNQYVQQNKFIGNTIYKNENPFIDSIFPNQEMRLLTLSRYWNIVNYYYPYKLSIGINWDSLLIKMIPIFKYAIDTMTYHVAILQLIASIKDSHAIFATKYTNQFFGYKGVPFSIKILENKAIVTDILNDSLSILNDIQYGDVFLEIDNVKIKDVVYNKSPYISASNEASLLRNVSQVLFNGQTDSVITKFERNGLIYEKYLYRYSFMEHYNNIIQKDITWKSLENDIGYIDLSRLQGNEVKGAFKKLKDTKVIILDVRGYPFGTIYKLTALLKHEKSLFALVLSPNMDYPGMFTYSQQVYCGKKNAKAYTGKVILLFNENSQSQAEFTIMALQTIPNVVSIGSQTAGSDGNISLIILPGNFRTYISGIGIFYPNGNETQRVGIIPDIEVIPTISGLKLYKDEVLDEAIKIAKEKL